MGSPEHQLLGSRTDSQCKMFRTSGTLKIILEKNYYVLLSKRGVWLGGLTYSIARDKDLSGKI